jgi:hypothetical protein
MRVCKKIQREKNYGMKTKAFVSGGKPLPIIYDGKPLKQAYRADLVCFGKIIRVIR